LGQKRGPASETQRFIGVIEKQDRGPRSVLYSYAERDSSARKTGIAESDTHVVSSRRLARVRTRKTSNAQIEPAAPSTAELRREGRLARIAKVLVSGATVTEIAEAEGIGRTLASREANSPECRQLIAEFVGDEWQEMRAVFYRSLGVIEDAFSARREYVTKDGQIMQGGPDHYARLAATKHFRDFLMASRPAPEQPEPKDKMLTLPELEAMLRANKALRDPTQTH
jgi:hypothetical protein